MVGDVIPVIHLRSIEQVRQNIDTCLMFGLNKVFIINHGYGIEAVVELTNVIYKIKQEYPLLWVGANFLQLSNSDAVKYASSYKLDALWSDNANLVRMGEDEEALIFKKQLDNLEHKIEFFGGVEFKYQPQPRTEDKKWVLERACKLVDVITTSGDKTGGAIQTDKLIRIRETIGADKPMAVASGVDESNVKLISQYANYMLVATSIIDIKTELIEIEKLEILLSKLP